MTSFTIAQLHELFRQFGLRQYLIAQNADQLRIGTNTFRNGRENCYLIDPEELFLYSLTRIKTGMTQEQIVDFYLVGTTIAGHTAIVGSCSTLTIGITASFATREFYASAIGSSNSERRSSYTARRIESTWMIKVE